MTPALGDKRLWRTTLPGTNRPGLPYGRNRLSPHDSFDRQILTRPLPVAGSPVVAMCGARRAHRRPALGKGELPKIERYSGPKCHLASAFDVNGDGKEDLVFTNPDFYCVADGASGDCSTDLPRRQTIFKQPSQGLYTCPAILEDGHKPPTVCLIAGHYFEGAMSIRTDAHWYKILFPGENRTAAEGFLKAKDGAWCMGLGRQNGNFACLTVADGSVRWELPLKASASDVVTCDVDADGEQEIHVPEQPGPLFASPTAYRLPWLVRHGTPCSPGLRSTSQVTHV